MGYTTLYRKFRPQIFDDVFGQEHIITALRNQVENGRIGHAYLFTGTRGTGKTTIAKIFSKVVNCEHPINGNPCGVCDSCKKIAENASLSVIEIDGASNNGIDNIRNIIEEVSYPPVDGKYKVYIIDEVHAISTQAFNALLKTLEEPPSYVIFILATTEVGALPNTILSRCQRYDFHRISVSVIEDCLKKVITEEHIDAEDKAIRYIARLADGSMRDGLSLLDQGIAFSVGDELRYDRMLQVLGAVDTSIFSRLVRAVHEQEAIEALRIVDEIMMEGKEPTIFATDFVWYLRSLLLVKSGEDMENILDISSENQSLLSEEAGMIEEDTLMGYIKVMSEAITQLRFSSIKRVTLEVAIIRLCRPQTGDDYNAIIKRLESLEKQIENGVVQKVTERSVHLEEKKGVEKTPEREPVSNNKSPSTSLWEEVLSQVDAATRACLNMADIIEKDNSITISVDTTDPTKNIAYAKLSDKERQKQLFELIKTIAKREIAVSLVEKTRETVETISAVEQFEQKTGIIVETEDF